MRLRTLSCLLLLAITFDAAASNLYTAINRLRAGEGNCAFAVNPKSKMRVYWAQAFGTPR